MNVAVRAIETREIVVDEVFPHKPEVLWKTLTAPELMGRWLKMQPAGFAAVVGNHFTYKTTPAGAWDGVIRCEVLEVIANERLVYSWVSGDDSNNGRYGARLDTVVTVTLTKVGVGTRLRLVHSGFELPRNETAYTGMSGGWVGVVQRIGELSSEQGGEQ